ncbi:hypothetical protein ABVK25_002928 [Lepraria finkii]|uniref:TLC domain-containing protein n=1 Tax=Lepraria finkii TaxID=1340010 RepID=A0ABR4BFA4_9LECA
MPDIDPHIPGDEHIKHTPLTILSKLSPYSGLILAVVLVILFLIKQNILEAFLLRRLYTTKYTLLSDRDRRGFLNHHIAGGTKLLILIVGVYPFIDVAFRYAQLGDRFAPHSKVTLGDVLVVCTQVLCGMYIFELIYRVKVSPIATMHHLGTILVGEAAVAISLDLSREKNATIEFILCTVWGAFDIICELLPHIAIILYRLRPTHHLFLSRLFRFAAISTFFGTICETFVIFYLFGSLWPQWQIAFKIVTPLLHCAFSATQLHGSWIFWKMWKRQEKLLAEKLEEGDEE